MSRIFSTPETVYEVLSKDSELVMALSQIHRGCLPHATDDLCAMIFKEEEAKAGALENVTNISTRFFTVEKEEFPSVAMEVRITTDKNLKLKYEYFFLTESYEEIFFLKTLSKLRTFSLLFLCGATVCSVTAEMDDEELKSLTDVVCFIEGV